MDKDFLGKFFTAIFTSLFVSGIVAGIVYALFTSSSETPLAIPLLVFIGITPFLFYHYLKDEVVNALKPLERKLQDDVVEIKSELEKATREVKARNSQIYVLETTLKEKSAGFPTLFDGIDFFHKLMDEYLANQLINKSHPAIRSAEEIKEQSRRRREAEKKEKITRSIIEFYEELEPSLVEYKNEEFGDINEILQEWTDEEKSDPVSYLLNKDEYRKLSVTEKNQLALDRYWKRPHSKWHIGIMYERYIGYIYEKAGYDVIYHGVKEGKRDLGRDLIAQKGDEFIVIQCKYWNQFRKVFENEIFQFFGTVFQYKHANKKKKVKGIFYTTTEVSDLAQSFAKELGIELRQDYKMDRSYPCIKCNISQIDGSKIYHLPFDQQYDNVLIEKEKGEFYATTVKEAENRGFRRAWKWLGTS